MLSHVWRCVGALFHFVRTWWGVVVGRMNKRKDHGYLFKGDVSTQLGTFSLLF